MDISLDLLTRIERVRLLALDVDGVLTDGGVYVLDDGQEFRRFSIKDGLGIRLVLARGIRVCFISSGIAGPVHHRARNLGVSEVHTDVHDKLPKLTEICRRTEIDLSEVAYMGDDLPDITPLRAVGLPCAPADAVLEVRRRAVYVTEASGGQGAVREICDILTMNR